MFNYSIVRFDDYLPVSGVSIIYFGHFASSHANDDVGAVHGMDFVVVRSIVV